MGLEWSSGASEYYEVEFNAEFKATLKTAICQLAAMHTSNRIFLTLAPLDLSYCTVLVEVVE